MKLASLDDTAKGSGRRCIRALLVPQRPTAPAPRVRRSGHQPGVRPAPGRSARPDRGSAPLSAARTADATAERGDQVGGLDAVAAVAWHPVMAAQVARTCYRTGRHRAGTSASRLVTEVDSAFPDLLSVFLR
jgi:hypothetical protein